MVETKSKLLLFTDCDFFAGCEKPLENIVSYPKITEKYNIVYAYRYSKQYYNDIREKKLNARLLPLYLVTPDLLLGKVSKKRKFFYMLLKVFVRIPEKLQFFNVINFTIQLFVLLKEKPDVVHINNGGYPGADSCLMMAIACGLLKIKNIIFTVNNMAAPSKHILDKLIDSKVNNYVTSFVTASNAAGQHLIKSRNVGERNMYSIPNAVLYDDIKLDENISLKNEFGIDEGTFIIGSAGLLIERKGYDVLIEAVNKMPKRKKWVLLIFGDGDQREVLQNLINKYKLQDSVFMPGYRANIHSYVDKFDAFVLSSTGTEDMPNAINEAMLIGKPIIGTRTSGVPEQIEDSINGFLVSPGDIEELSSKIDKIIGLDNEELLKMGRNSKEKYMKFFSYNLAMDRYLELYNA